MPLFSDSFLSTESGTFLDELHNENADEWEKMTGAFETARASFIVFTDTCDKSIIMPSRFISIITVYIEIPFEFEFEIEFEFEFEIFKTAIKYTLLFRIQLGHYAFLEPSDCQLTSSRP